MYRQQTAFETIVGKGEIAPNEQFLLFPQCFQLYQITFSPFVQIFDIISLFAFGVEEPKIGILGKGLTAINSDTTTPRSSGKQWFLCFQTMFPNLLSSDC